MLLDFCRSRIIIEGVKYMQRLLIDKKEKQKFRNNLDDFINNNIRINPESSYDKIENYEELKNRIIERLNNSNIEDTIFIYNECVKNYDKQLLIFEGIGKHNTIVKVGICKECWYKTDKDTKEKILISKYNELIIQYKYELQKYDDFNLHNKILELYKQIILLNYNTKIIATLDEYLSFALYKKYIHTSYRYEDVIKQKLEIIPSDYNDKFQLIKKELPRMINNLKCFIKNNKINYDELSWKSKSIEWKEYEV